METKNEWEERAALIVKNELRDVMQELADIEKAWMASGLTVEEFINSLNLSEDDHMTYMKTLARIKQKDLMAEWDKLDALQQEAYDADNIPYCAWLQRRMLPLEAEIKRLLNEASNARD